jgi:superoxide dismutase, Fe-Mn family
MKKPMFFVLPDLPYDYKDLEPYISEELLMLHHQKHHQAYITQANLILEEIDTSRSEGRDPDGIMLKSLSFHAGGAILHGLFWENLLPINGEERHPSPELAEAISEEFGNMERFKKEFIAAGLQVEGSGWTAMAYSDLGRLMVMQIEKHNLNIYPNYQILLVADVFEHAYYLDYKQDKAKYLEAIWNIINWTEVEKRLNRVARRS